MAFNELSKTTIETFVIADIRRMHLKGAALEQGLQVSVDPHK
jgi:hypothetical protein